MLLLNVMCSINGQHGSQALPAVHSAILHRRTTSEEEGEH